MKFLIGLCAVLLSAAMLVSRADEASNPEPLQLFYDLSAKDIKQTQVPAPSALSKPKPTISIKPKKKKTTFQYNGYINAPTGRHYYINGARLISFPSIKLVSVQLGGRLLRLKIPGGRVVEIGIGETVHGERQ